jgi:NAD(P)H-nitrite reductase large subunit
MHEHGSRAVAEDDDLGEPAGEILCQCYWLTRGEIYRLIRSRGFRTPWEVGREIGAGLGCGACRGEPRGIEDMLKRASPPSKP